MRQGSKLTHGKDMIKPEVKISIGAYKIDLRIEQELDDLKLLHFVTAE